MEETTGFAAFAMFHALKLHFHGSYDYVKYHGKTNVSKDTFSNRKDKYTFYKFSRKYHLDDLRNFYIANFISKEVNWIGDISGPDGEQTYKQWQSRVQRLTYMFEQDGLSDCFLRTRDQEGLKQVKLVDKIINFLNNEQESKVTDSEGSS